MHNEKRTVFPYIITVHKQMKIFLWESTPTLDRFLTDKNGHLYLSENMETAKLELSNLPFTIRWSEAGHVDFDIFWKEMDFLSPESVTGERGCEVLLNGINFIDDMVKTLALTGENRCLYDSSITRSYKKLFFGNNLTAVTPGEKKYHPAWEAYEIRDLKEALTHAWNAIAMTTGIWDARN